MSFPMNPGGHPDPEPTRENVERVANALDAIRISIGDNVICHGAALFLRALLDRAEKAEEEKDIVYSDAELSAAERDAARAEGRKALREAAAKLRRLAESRTEEWTEDVLEIHDALLALADQEPER